MYFVTFKSKSVEDKYDKVLAKLRSRKRDYNNAILAFESLKTAPRQYINGKKHPLTGNHNGQWALRIDDVWRLIYEINDRDLIVTGVEVSPHYKKKK